MKQIVVTIFLIITMVKMGASEISVDGNTFSPFVEKEFSQKRQRKSLEGRMKDNLCMIFIGSCLLSYTSHCVGVETGLFYIFRPDNNDYVSGVLFGFFSMFPCAAFLGYIVSGLILLLTGNKNYHSRRKTADPTLLTPLLEKKRESLQKMVLISGIVNGAGLVFGGTGAGMICGSLFGGYQEGLFVSGIVLAAVGGTALAVCLPMMITSLAMSGWLKGEMNRLSLDVSFVPEEKSSARGSSLSPWENNRLSLALKVRF